MIHHSDRDSEYVSIRYSERLTEAGVEPSVGSKGDSYDNALAETSLHAFRGGSARILNRLLSESSRFRMVKVPMGISPDRHCGRC